MRYFRAVKWQAVGAENMYEPSPSAAMTVASGAPSLMPMAAPNPQPRGPDGGVLNNELGRLSGRTSASRDVTASLTIIVLSSIRSPMHLESHTGLMGVWLLTASMLASTSRTIASCST